MLLKQFDQNGASLVRRTFEHIDLGEIQIRLIEAGRDSNAFFKTGDGFILPLSTQVKYSKIVQRLREYGARLQCSLQILVSMCAVIGLRKNHRQAVVCLRIRWIHFKTAAESSASFIPVFLQAICVSEIVECDQVIRA